jgi:hypothetical protein
MVYVAVVQAITTLLIGVFAGYIAWRQWRTAQDRLVLDLFERRFQVFQELTRTIADAFSTKANVQISDLANFDAATEKARYLFGADVHEYLKQVRSKLIVIHTIELSTPISPRQRGAEKSRREANGRTR